MIAVQFCLLLGSIFPSGMFFLTDILFAIDQRDLLLFGYCSGSCYLIYAVICFVVGGLDSNELVRQSFYTVSLLGLTLLFYQIVLTVDADE